MIKSPTVQVCRVGNLENSLLRRICVAFFWSRGTFSTENGVLNVLFISLSSDPGKSWPCSAIKMTFRRVPSTITIASPRNLRWRWREQSKRSGLFVSSKHKVLTLFLALCSLPDAPRPRGVTTPDPVNLGADFRPRFPPSGVGFALWHCPGGGRLSRYQASATGDFSAVVRGR